MRSVLLATCSAYPAADEDAAALCDALRDCNVNARWAAWDDPGVEWCACLTVLRSTRDHTLRRAQFLDWVGQVPALLNPAAVVLWNSDKTYLRDLGSAGTPTRVAPPGAVASFPSDCEFVVKPSVGAGSRGVGRFRPSEVAGAARHAAALHAAGRTVLVQPYLSEVDEAGETALIYVDGEFSHAVRKGPMLVGAADRFPAAIAART